MTLPLVSTDLHVSQERQHRTQIANALNECIKVRPPHDLTEAETAAGIPVFSFGYPPMHLWRYMTSEQIADVITGALSEDIGGAFNNMIAVMAAAQGGDAIIPPGKYLFETQPLITGYFT